MVDGWFATLIRIAESLGPTDHGLNLTIMAGELALATMHGSRTLEVIDRDIALVNVRVKELKARRLGMFLEMPLMGKLHLELEKLLSERENLLLRQRGSNPEKLARAKLRDFDRREGRRTREIIGIDRRHGRSEIVIQFDDQRFGDAISEEAAEVLLSKGWEEIL